MDSWFMLLACAGITQICVRGIIFKVPRDRIKAWALKHGKPGVTIYDVKDWLWGDYLNEWASCCLCLGFMVGLIVFWSFWGACAASAASVLLDSVLDHLEEPQ